MLSKMFFKPC